MIHHLRKLFKIIQPIINFIFYHDKDIFYGRFLGSIDLKHLILENLLRPGRSLRRLQHNRLFPIKFKVNNTSTSINVSALNLQAILHIVDKYFLYNFLLSIFQNPFFQVSIYLVNWSYILLK